MIKLAKAGCKGPSDVIYNAKIYNRFIYTIIHNNFFGVTNTLHLLNGKSFRLTYKFYRKMISKYKSNTNNALKELWQE